ncbi:MAG: hypothetical protein R8L07_13300 [Alphaproteobacteria bacterium]|nr:hypothetical protein [Alphaproteobacteria bacterium]
MTGIGGLARNLALFALLLQFTLPVGLAIAADLPGAQLDPAAVFDCLGGSREKGEASVSGLHGCVLPGGCCVPGGSVCPCGLSAKGAGTVLSAASPHAGAPPIPARPSAQNLVRGPPNTSA